MINKIYGEFYALCDGCGEELGPSDTFEEAKSQIDDEGWDTKRVGGDWVSLCPTCIKEMNK